MATINKKRSLFYRLLHSLATATVALIVVSCLSTLIWKDPFRGKWDTSIWLYTVSIASALSETNGRGKWWRKDKTIPKEEGLYQKNSDFIFVRALICLTAVVLLFYGIRSILTRQAFKVDSGDLLLGVVLSFVVAFRYSGEQKKYREEQLRQTSLTGESHHSGGGFNGAGDSTTGNSRI